MNKKRQLIIWNQCIFIVTFVLLLLSHQIFAQDELKPVEERPANGDSTVVGGSISGFVFNSEGATIPDIAIKLMVESVDSTVRDGEVVMSRSFYDVAKTSTGREGEYTFRNLKSGTYFLFAAHSHYDYSAYQWYDGGSSINEATPIVLKEGDDGNSVSA